MNRPSLIPAQGVGIPTLKLFNFSDTIILIVLSAIATLSKVTKSFAVDPWMFYAGKYNLCTTIRILIVYNMCSKYDNTNNF